MTQTQIDVMGLATYGMLAWGILCVWWMTTE